MSAAGQAAPKETWASLDAQFADPPNQYRLAQYMGHGAGDIPLEEIEAYGIGGVVLFMACHEYLRNEDHWDTMVRNIKAAKAAGLQVWVADDNGYPSGMAGGLVVEKDPAFEARGLSELRLEGNGLAESALSLPENMERFIHAVVYPIKNGRPNLDKGQPAKVMDAVVRTQGLDGAWVLVAHAVRVINEGTQALQTAKTFGHPGRYANLLNADAMEAFVDMTHGEYARRLGGCVSDIDLFYTNEPNLMVLWFDPKERPDGTAIVPWDTTLPARFQADHGYALAPKLQALFSGDDDAAKLERRHFYQTVGNMLAENFSGRIARQAEKIGVRSGGHLLLEEHTSMHVASYGNFLQVLGEQHVPGCDIPMPDEGNFWNYWMPKLIASAAPETGDGMVTALLDPIIGRPKPLLDPTPEEFRRYINMAFLAGVNQISTYIPWKNFTPETYTGFNEYVGRLALMLRSARNAAQVGIYYPIETFQANFIPSPQFWSPLAWSHREAETTQNTLAKGLFEARIDFTHVTAEAILGAQIADGHLLVRGNLLHTVLMPHVELLPLDVLRKLEAFEDDGGTVVWVETVPRLGGTADEHGEVRKALADASPIDAVEALDVEGKTLLWKRLRFEGPEEGFLVSRFLRDGWSLYYLVNNTGEDMAVSVSGSANAKVYAPLDGSIMDLRVPGKVTIPAWGTVFVLETGSQ